MRKIPIDFTRIEKRIQNFVENFGSLFPSQMGPSEFVNILVDKIKIFLQSQSTDSPVAPNKFSILIPKKTFHEWTNYEEVISSLVNQLMQVCSEEGIELISPPIINLVEQPDPNITVIKIIAEDPTSDFTPTAEMTPYDELKYKQKNTKAYLIIKDKEILYLEKKTTNLGRSKENDIVIDDQHVSRQHAQIRNVQGNYVLFDLDARGGTFVNAKKINQAVLKPGDVISLAGFALIFGKEIEEDSESDEDMTAQMKISDNSTE